MLPNATALLVFAQSASNDAVSKRFARPISGSRQVVQRLNERVWQTAVATKLPVFHSSDLIVHVGTFGEQITNALRATFALGFERVLVVGNDCPALTTAHLTEAAHQLQSQRVVLGPDRRGGLYLFGLSRDAFDPALLPLLPWQTTQLAQGVQQAFANDFVTILPRLGDVNTYSDLQYYRATTSAVALFVTHLLSLATCTPVLFAFPRVFRLIQIRTNSGSLRAPPAFGTRLTA